MNPAKYWEVPSAFLYYLRWIIPEFIGIFTLYIISKNILYYFGYYWIPFHIIILIILFFISMDSIEKIRFVIISDLTEYLRFDFIFTSREYGPWYSHFAGKSAYYWSKTYRKQKSCPICLIRYSNNHSIIILSCGHKFHRSCIDDWECIKWNNLDSSSSSSYKYPNSKCPICRERYDTIYDKHKIDANCQSKHCVKKRIPIPGDKLFERYIWNHEYVCRGYISHCLNIRKNKKHYRYQYC